MSRHINKSIAAFYFSMGKHKRKNRSRSGSSESRQSLRARLNILERELDKVKRYKDVSEHRSRSRSRHYNRKTSRGRSPSETNLRNSENHHRHDIRYSRGRSSSMADRHRERERHSLTPATPPQSSAEPDGVLRVDYRQSVDGRSLRGSESPAERTGADLGVSNKNSNEDDILILNDVSEDTLQMLGADPDKPKVTSYTLHEAVASRWNYYLTNGLSKEEAAQLQEKHSVPNNCNLLLPPKVNTEVKAIMSAAHLTRDSSHLGYQLQVGTGLSAMGKAMNAILEEEKRIPKEVREKMLSSLSEASRCFTGLFHNISKTRKYLITPVLNKTVKEMTDSTIPGEFLFGPDLGERVKNIKSLEKAGQDLRSVLSTPRVTQPGQRRAFSGGKKGGGVAQSTTPLNRNRPTHKREVRHYKGHYPSKQSRHQYVPKKR